MAQRYLQPQAGPFALNYSNPLTRGLVFDWEAFQPGKELVTNVFANTNNTTISYNTTGKSSLCFSGQVNVEFAKQFITTSDGVGTGDFTICIRANPSSAGSLGHMFAQKNDAGGSPFAQMCLFANGSSGGGDSPGDLTFFLYPNPSSGADAVTISGACDGTWHTWTARRQGLVLNIWRDNTLVGSTTPAAVCNILQGSPQRYTAVGSRGNGNTQSYVNNIQFARGWNRALSDAEIKSLASNPWQIFQSRQLILKVAGGTDATASGTTASAIATFLNGTATGQVNATANGSIVSAIASLLAGSASGGASATASGVIVTATATLLSGAASGGSNATAPGTTAAASATFLPGTATGVINATISGIVNQAIASLINGSASGNVVGPTVAQSKFSISISISL